MSRRDLGPCPGSRGKRSYRNRHAARTAIERIAAAKRLSRQPVARLWVYRCRVPGCGAFHLTHLAPDIAQARLRAVAQGLDPDQPAPDDTSDIADSDPERRTA